MFEQIRKGDCFVLEEGKRIENRRKGSKKYMIMLFLLALIVGGSCGLYYVDTFYGQGKINTILYSLQRNKNTDTEETEETGDTGEITDDITEENSISLSSSGALFLTKGKKFLMCTKDGARYMNSMGDQKWNDTFTMTAPELIEEGNYYAIGDLSGKSVKVYNETGLLYSVQNTGNVLYFALNRNGYLGVITKEKELYTAMVYDEAGEQLTGRQEGEKGVYPLSIDISDDNRVFVISYLDTTDVEPIGKVNFYYVNESEGKNFSESMFSAVIKKNELIPKVFYLDNGSAIAVSDRALYGMSSNGEQRWEIELTNHISYIGVEKKKYIVAAYGSAISGQNSRTEGNVSWINGDGKEIANFQPRDAVTYLNCNSTGTVLGCNKTYYGFKIGGRAFWEYTATRDMTDVLLMEKVNHVLFVTNDSAVILNMDKVSQDTTVNEQKQDSRNVERVIRKQKEQDDENSENSEQQNQQNEDGEKESQQNTEQQDEQNEQNGEQQQDEQNKQNKQQQQDEQGEQDSKQEQDEQNSSNREGVQSKQNDTNNKNDTESQPNQQGEQNEQNNQDRQSQRSNENTESKVKQSSR